MIHLLSFLMESQHHLEDQYFQQPPTLLVNHHHHAISTRRYISFERLAKSVVELQSLLQTEGDTNLTLLEENFSLKLKLGQKVATDCKVNHPEKTTVVNNRNNQIERKEQSDKTENNNDVKSKKLPIVYEDSSVEKVEKVQKRRIKRRKTTEAIEKRKIQHLVPQQVPNVKKAVHLRHHSIPKVKKAAHLRHHQIPKVNSPQERSNLKSSSDDTCLSTEQTNLVTSHSKPAHSNNEVVNTPKIPSPENTTANDEIL